MLMKEILLTKKKAWHRWVEQKMDGPLLQFFFQAIAIQKGWEAAAVKVVLGSKEPKNIGRKAWRISRSG
jgi:hypothetical protein